MVVRFGLGDGLGRDGLLGEKSDLAAQHPSHAVSANKWAAGRRSDRRRAHCTLRVWISRELAFVGLAGHAKRASERMPYASSVPAMVMVVVVMMMSDHKGCSGAAALGQTLIVGFQQR